MNLMPNQTQPTVVVVSQKSFLLKPKFLVPLALLALLVVFGVWLISRGQIAKPAPQPTPTLKKDAPTFVCPSIKEFCQNGQDIVRNRQYIGFGGKTSSGSPIYAAFDGKVAFQTITLSKAQGGEIISHIFLDDDQQNLHALYLFKGGPRVELTQAKAGQKLAEVGETINYYDNASLVFSLRRYLEQQQAEDIKITPESFQQFK